MTKLKFFADHCISNYVVNFLNEIGFEVFKLRDHILTDSPDSFVIEKAQELNSILITLNGDFTDIVTFPPSDYNGIIALQIRNHPEIIPYIIKRLFDKKSKYGTL